MEEVGGGEEEADGGDGGDGAGEAGEEAGGRGAGEEEEALEEGDDGVEVGQVEDGEYGEEYGMEEEEQHRLPLVHAVDRVDLVPVSSTRFPHFQVSLLVYFLSDVGPSIDRYFNPLLKEKSVTTATMSLEIRIRSNKFSGFMRKLDKQSKNKK